jgi:hypothetical protein
MSDQWQYQLGEHKELWGSDVSRDIVLLLIGLAATF